MGQSLQDELIEENVDACTPNLATFSKSLDCCRQGSQRSVARSDTLCMPSSPSEPLLPLAVAPSVGKTLAGATGNYIKFFFLAGGRGASLGTNVKQMLPIAHQETQTIPSYVGYPASRAWAQPFRGTTFVP